MKLHIQRTHSQTMSLIRETQKMTLAGITTEYRVLAVCHVRDEVTLARWHRQGGEEPEVQSIYANRVHRVPRKRPA